MRDRLMLSRMMHLQQHTAISNRISSTQTFQNEEDKAESLDKKMNKVYRAAQFILLPARFTAVKKEQIEWLKKRNAAPSTEEKCKLMEARIKALQELVW
jgi:uncharacterized protein YecT (DUF1311 family)